MGGLGKAVMSKDGKRVTPQLRLVLGKDGQSRTDGRDGKSGTDGRDGKSGYSQKPQLRQAMETETRAKDGAGQSKTQPNNPTHLHHRVENEKSFNWVLSRAP